MGFLKEAYLQTAVLSSFKWVVHLNRFSFWYESFIRYSLNSFFPLISSFIRVLCRYSKVTRSGKNREHGNLFAGKFWHLEENFCLWNKEMHKEMLQNLTIFGFLIGFPGKSAFLPALKVTLGEHTSYHMLDVRMLVLMSETTRPKKKIVLPSSGISEYLDWLVNLFFLKSTEKYNIRVHFHLFSQKRWKNNQSDKRLGAFLTLTFFKFYFWRWLVAKGNTTTLFSLYIK